MRSSREAPNLWAWRVYHETRTGRKRADSPKDRYLISSLNCGDEDFAIACMRSNLEYGNNQKREDVKSHHYIISFGPRDAADNSLTADKA